MALATLSASIFGIFVYRDLTSMVNIKGMVGRGWGEVPQFV